MRSMMLAVCLFVIGARSALGLEMVAVAENVWAVVGDLGQRSSENLGNNATFGVVLTTDGVVLIDSGGSAAGAAAIDREIRKVTAQPVVAVINTGGQDHRWLGNGYWKARGARIIASARAVEDQRERLDQQWTILSTLVGENTLAGTTPAFADETFRERLDLVIGGERFELRHTGVAHTPGDAVVWLPSRRIVFAGDIVFVDRMLGILPVSRVDAWITAFDAMAALEPSVVVPGHGRPTTLAGATAATRDYLAHLRDAVRKIVKQGGGMSDAARIDQSRFLRLTGADQLAGRNAQAVFEQLEFDEQ
ncbi:MBL fold metallo-hydrolase [Rhodoplanes azumiensis]|uniref:MBL fold metallo-hydrolase n=1 Tax=Rhodoplanes azumiensis TaxID=1897628 RepID=A0ABW5AI04_9BRAD